MTYSMTPLMFVSALIQYNSGINAVSTNARFRWEYRPGSELFVVYNEERNTLTRSFPVPQQPCVHRENQSTLSALAVHGPPVHGPRSPVLFSLHRYVLAVTTVEITVRSAHSWYASLVWLRGNVFPTVAFMLI